MGIIIIFCVSEWTNATHDVTVELVVVLHGVPFLFSLRVTLLLLGLIIQYVICPKKVGVEYVNTCIQELFIMY